MITGDETNYKQKYYSQEELAKKGKNLKEKIGKGNNSDFDTSNIVDGDDEKTHFGPPVIQPFFKDKAWKVINFQNPTKFDNNDIQGMLINQNMAFRPVHKCNPKPRNGDVQPKFNATTHVELADFNIIVCIENVPKLILVRNALTDQEQNGLKSLCDLHKKKDPKLVTDQMCKASGIPDMDRIRNAIKDPKFDKDFGSKGCKINSIKLSGE